MFPFDAILECCCIGNSTNYDLLEDQQPLGFRDEKKQRPHTTESLATDILSTLYNAETNDKYLTQRLEDIVHETGWYEGLASAVLNGLENAIKAGAPMGQAMKDAYDMATQAAEAVWGFAKDHPVFCAVVALGILVILAPWAIEALGFGEFGPIEGTFAAWWQSTYEGYVPAGSLFSFLQRLGMRWGGKWITST